MRKLAPMFIAASTLALAGAAFANTSDVNSTDKNGQPTVSANTNKQPLSYSDKSSVAKGTNARMDDDTAKADAAAGEDKKEMRDESKDADKAAKKTTRHAKAKHVKKHKDTTTAARDTSTDMPTAKPSPSSDNPPPSATKGEVANSLTGKSAGQ